MIKILSTTDWHIGNNFHGFDRHDEHKHFLDWLLDIVELKKPDALLIAGDVYDNSNPSAVSQELFYSFLDRLTAGFPFLKTVIIAGNHDSAARLEAPRTMLERHNVYIRGVVKRKPDGETDYNDLIVNIISADGTDSAIVLAVPYLRDGDFQRGMAYSEGVNSFISGMLQHACRIVSGESEQDSAYTEDGNNNDAYKSSGTNVSYDKNIILMAHLYASGSEISENSSERIVVGGSEQVDMAMLDPKISLTLLGHLHRRQFLGGRENIIYPGSALPMSFTEKSYKHGVVFVQLENGSLVSSPEYIDYPIQHNLVSIPDKPQPLDDVLKLLSGLPSANQEEMSPFKIVPDGICSSDSKACSSDNELHADCYADQSIQMNNEPYIEVQVMLESPMIGISKKIEDALSGKAVRLCRIVTAYPSVSPDSNTSRMESIEDLINRNPIEVIKKSYYNKYGCEMRDELVSLANLAIEEARKEGNG